MAYEETERQGLYLITENGEESGIISQIINLVHLKDGLEIKLSFRNPKLMREKGSPVEDLILYAAHKKYRP